MRRKRLAIHKPHIRWNSKLRLWYCFWRRSYGILSNFGEAPHDAYKAMVNNGVVTHGK